jgi:hypothetical protein
VPPLDRTWRTNRESTCDCQDRAMSRKPKRRHSTASAKSNHLQRAVRPRVERTCMAKQVPSGCPGILRALVTPPWRREKGGIPLFQPPNRLLAKTPSPARNWPHLQRQGGQFLSWNCRSIHDNQNVPHRARSLAMETSSLGAPTTRAGRPRTTQPPRLRQQLPHS